MTPLEKIKYVKEKANIVDVIGHFVQLKRNGSGYSGVSPFSNERTGSFTIQPAKRFFKCFSSGKSGDVIDFVSAIKGITSKEAIQWIIDFYNIPQAGNEWNYTPVAELPTSYIDFQLFARTIDTGQPNHFFTWLRNTTNVVHAFGAIQNYKIGTSKHWHGANIFWQIDTENRIRSGKIMLYNPENGKRVKIPKPHITWVHTVAKINDYVLSQCLYGEHLLSERPDAVVKIVESEKTAILASIIYPEFIWLASGSLTNLSVSRCLPLRNRIISLIPDVGAEQAWLDKCQMLKEMIPANWAVDCLPSGYEKGYDLCDYILDNKI